MSYWKITTPSDLPGEQWAPIKGFEKHYEISSLGRVRSLGVYNHPASIKKQNLHKSGYLLVSLWKDNREKKCLVHRLVAINFIPNPDNKPEVNHKNGIRHDNRVIELEWVTCSENHLHAFRELGKQNVRIYGSNHHRSRPVLQSSLNNTFIKKFDSVTLAALAVGLTPSLISRTCQGRQKTSGGFKWMYSK